MLHAHAKACAVYMQHVACGGKVHSAKKRLRATLDCWSLLYGLRRSSAWGQCAPGGPLGRTPASRPVVQQQALGAQAAKERCDVIQRRASAQPKMDLHLEVVVVLGPQATHRASA